MPPKVKKEAIAVIVDVRKDLSNLNGDDSWAFTKAKECACKIVLKKILGAYSDDIALIILGSEITDNAVDENITYDYINVLRGLQPATWDMLEDLSSELKAATDCGGDVLEAIVVAISILRPKDPADYTAMKIILISSAGGSSNEGGVDVLVPEMKRLGIQFNMIGPNIAEHTQSQDIDEVVKDMPAERRVAVRLVAETEGWICRFGYALEQLTKIERMKKRGTPWKVCMKIGPDIKIPVFGIIKVAPEDEIKPKTELVVETTQGGEKIEEKVARDFVYTAPSATSIHEEPVEKEEIVDGYNFGSTVVSISADDRSFDYKSGPKSLNVLYFTDASNVPKHLYIGSGSSFYFPVDEPHAKAAFSALVYAMVEENVVAIVRRVYNNNNNPVLAVMAPRIKEKYECLVFVALPFSDDVKRCVFAPLTSKKSEPSEDQLKAVDELITSMDLMKIPNEDGELEEAFRPKATLDPVQQHLYEVICKRVQNCEKEISKPSDDVKMMLTPPSFVEKQSRKVLEKVKALFPLQEMKPKEGERMAASTVFKQDTTNPSQVQVKIEVRDESQKDALETIGTLDPIEDFKRMLVEKRIPFGEVCAQMQSMILNFVEHAFDIDDMKKTVLSVKVLRHACLEKDPAVYNSWISSVRDNLQTVKKSFWSLIVDEKLALITSEESGLSKVSQEEADDFVRERAPENEEEPMGDDSLNDLLDEM